MVKKYLPERNTIKRRHDHSQTRKTQPFQSQSWNAKSFSSQEKKKKLLFPNIPSPISAVSPGNAQGEALGWAGTKKTPPPPPPRPARFPRSPASDHATPHPAALPHFRPGRSFPPRSAAAARGLTLPRPGHTPGRPPPGSAPARSHTASGRPPSPQASAGLPAPLRLPPATVRRRPWGGGRGPHSLDDSEVRVGEVPRRGGWVFQGLQQGLKAGAGGGSAHGAAGAAARCPQPRGQPPYAPHRLTGLRWRRAGLAARGPGLGPDQPMGARRGGAGGRARGISNGITRLPRARGGAQSDGWLPAPFGHRPAPAHGGHRPSPPIGGGGGGGARGCRSPQAVGLRVRFSPQPLRATNHLFVTGKQSLDLPQLLSGYSWSPASQKPACVNPTFLKTWIRGSVLWDV